MFEKITINQINDFSNPGLLCQSLIFYRKVILIIDPGNIEDFIRYCGYDNLIEIINAGQLEIKLSRQSNGAGQLNENNYMIGTFTPIDLKYKKPQVIRKAVTGVYGAGVQSSNRTRHLIRLIDEHKYDDKYEKYLDGELKNEQNIKAALKLIGVESENIDISIRRMKKGIYRVDSDLEANLIRDALYMLTDGTSQIFDGDTYQSSFATNKNISNYVTSKINRVINSRLTEETQLDNFHEFILPEYADLQGTINSGAQNFDSFMPIWGNSLNFRDWIQDDVNANVVTDYIRKIGENNWLSQAPLSIIRWMVFATIGTVLSTSIGGTLGTLAGLGVDGFDDLILNKIVKGKWKPNQFVDNNYKSFLNVNI